MTPSGNNGIPRKARYLYQQGLDYSLEGRVEDAISSLSAAVQAEPRFCSAYNAMGNCLDRLGRYEEAIRNYEKVIELDPSHAGARFKRDLVLLKVLRRCNEIPVSTDPYPQKNSVVRSDAILQTAGGEPLWFFRYET
jgi:tetratricopeptide (TPR) repeat protein